MARFITHGIVHEGAEAEHAEVIVVGFSVGVKLCELTSSFMYMRAPAHPQT